MADSDRAPSPPPPARKPTPVRKALKQDAPEVPTDPPPPSRTFEAADGARWRVEVAGRTTTGLVADSGAPLLLLVFQALSAEGEPREDVDRREALVPAAALGALPDDRLAELLDGSSVLEFEPSDLFPGTRRTRRRG